MILHKSVVLDTTLTNIYVKSSVENGYGREDFYKNYYFDTFRKKIPDEKFTYENLQFYNML